MLVSWKWLHEYVDPKATHEEVARRLMMAGLNHESTEPVGDDWRIDLEVTSNRPDCLGHIGVAREIAVLFGQPLKRPDPKLSPSAGSAPIAVEIAAPKLCKRYIARVIKGVKIAASPKWLVDRLATIGVASVNNVVDVTNYVMMECGQPLHAFDLKHIQGGKIVVRAAKSGEKFTAINHQEYALDDRAVVIADANRAVALGGVMGGAESEVSPSTVDLVIEAADFDQLSIRATARRLKLHSPSSYRFERGMDPEGIDWASRRCCQLIVELAGGTVVGDAVAAGEPMPQRSQVDLRFARVNQVLGIPVEATQVRKILRALGCEEHGSSDGLAGYEVPSWRRDLTREIDLVEEVARIHGYEHIPEDRAVPMTASFRLDFDRTLEKIRRVLCAAGFDEAMTASLVPTDWSSAFSPWTDAEPYVSGTPMLQGADRIRRSLVPSLLEARRFNESLSNPIVELFETAKIYLPQPAGLPREQRTLALASGRDFLHVKGTLESIVAELNPNVAVVGKSVALPLVAAGKGLELSIDGRRLGFVGVLSEPGKKAFKLRQPATIAEVDLDLLAEIAVRLAQAKELSAFPGVSRDVNVIVDEAIRWADLERTIRASAGDRLESLAYLDTYRDPAKDGAGKKRLLFSMVFRSVERTMTSAEVDATRDNVVTACRERHQAALVG